MLGSAGQDEGSLLSSTSGRAALCHTHQKPFPDASPGTGAELFRKSHTAVRVIRVGTGIRELPQAISASQMWK